jgi:hypothetical protein
MEQVVRLLTKNYKQFKQKANSAMSCSGPWFDKKKIS